MATHHGKDGAVYVGSDQVAEIKSFEIEESQESADDTAMGDSWGTSKGGIKKWTAKIECMWDETDTNGQGALTLGASATFNMFPEGNDTGAAYYTGTAEVRKRGHDQALDGLVMRTIEVEGQGALTESTVS